MCEKPLAIDVNSARAMTAAVPAGVVTAVPFVYRFYPMVREARARVRSGELGDLHLLHGHYLQDWLSRPTDANWRVDAERGGASRAFADIGIHWCDLVEFVSGHRLVRVIATTQTTFAGRGGARPTEDAATVLFETDHGAMGAVVVSQVSPGRKNRLWIELDGADGALSFDQELPESLWVGGRDEIRVVMRGSEANQHSADYNVVPVGHPQGYQDCFDVFVKDTYCAIGGDPPDGLPTFADGLRSAILTETVLAAAETRGMDGGSGMSSSESAPGDATAVAIAGSNIAKRFGHVNALINASITVHAGEVVALFGDNGAGKSTLLRCLQGIYHPDSGSVVIGGQLVTLASIRDAAGSRHRVRAPRPRIGA